MPFADGLEILKSLRGRRVVALASGDPFWFGAGSVIARTFPRAEWQVLSAPSTFALAAARMGWPVETSVCLGLHASPLSRMRPHLAPGVRILALLRDGDAVKEMAEYLSAEGFGASEVTALQALGGPGERVERFTAQAGPDADLTHPVCAAIEVAGDGAVVTAASGLDDTLFDSDGQITKRPMRALTLSALAPRPFERLWDIGGGSGSIAIEWLLSHPSTEAISVEVRADRAQRIAENAARLGVDRLRVVTGEAPEALTDLPDPDVVFVGGGLSERLLGTLAGRCAPGTRLVANAVTLESEALLTHWQGTAGGTLLRIELAEAHPLGQRRGWRAAYPVVQWSMTL